MPTSKPSRVKYVVYRKADDDFVRENYNASKLPSSLDRLKVTYGNLSRRPEVWGPNLYLQA